MTSTSTLRFLLNGKPVELAGFDPHTTLLQFLREQRRQTGTKEGCAEGDCGACTVVLGERTEDAQGHARVQLVPINACIRLLATLHGKAIFTVESLQAASGQMHPVQEAMLQCHGSQCGFCTPGFVMSLFALFKQNAQPSRGEVQQAISGNLCRCTGYRPILDAGQRMGELAIPLTLANSPTASCGTEGKACGSDLERWRFSPATQGGADVLPGETELAQQLQGLLAPITRTGTVAEVVTEVASEAALQIESAHGQFYAPRSIDQLSSAIAEHPDAWIVAGGTDIGLWITKALQTQSRMVYTGDVAALKTIATTADGSLHIGAAATLEQAFAALNRSYPELAHVWTRFASWPIRNSGTLGGNVANGSPIGDSMPALIAIGAQVVLQHQDQERSLPLEDLYLDYKKQARQPGEWVRAIVIPPRPAAASGSAADASDRIAAYKVARRNEQDISAVFAGFAVHVQAGHVTGARLAYGGMAATSRRAQHAEQSLMGQAWNAATVQKAMHALTQDFTPLSDMRASSDYRMQVAQNLLWRFWLESQATDDADASISVASIGLRPTESSLSAALRLF